MRRVLIVGAVALLMVGCAARQRPTEQAVSSARPVAEPTPPRPLFLISSSGERASRTRVGVAPKPHRRGSGRGRVIRATAYCLTGVMANGQRAFRGAVAGNGWPLGTRLWLSQTLPGVPHVVTVLDRVGWGSDLDIAVPGDCSGAERWGRRPITVTVLP